MDIQGFTPVAKRKVAANKPLSSRYALDNMPGVAPKPVVRAVSAIKKPQYAEDEDAHIMTPARFVRVAQKPVYVATKPAPLIDGIRAFGAQKFQGLLTKLAPKQIDKG